MSIIESVKKVLKDISTGIDGQTFCCSRLYGHVVIVTFVGLCIADFVSTGHFDPVKYGEGAGVIISGQGLAIWAKRDTEPK